MNEPLSKDGRMALITDVTGAPLDACEAEELELLADLLADPAMWDEPRPELEHLVVGAVAAADASVTPLPSRPVEHRRRRRGLFSVAGIAAAAAIVVVRFHGDGEPRASRRDAGPQCDVTIAGTKRADRHGVAVAVLEPRFVEVMSVEVREMRGLERDPKA